MRDVQVTLNLQCFTDHLSDLMKLMFDEVDLTETLSPDGGH